MDQYADVCGPVLEDLEYYHPRVVTQMTDWHPISRNEIFIKTENGEQYTYSFIGHVLRKLKPPKSDIDILSEEEWREVFAEQLCYKMKARGIFQDRLSELTGISRVTINRYINGKATPSTYNIRRIAKALGCSVINLIESDWKGD